MTTTTRAAVGTLEWEKLGGPPLTFPQKAELFAGYGSILTLDLITRCLMSIKQLVPFHKGTDDRAGLDAWTPPDSRIAREAEEYARDVSSTAMLNHCYRTYYFAALFYQSCKTKVPMDKEALYVASILHDVGLFQPTKPSNEHCFSVGSAREARRIARAAGWESARIDNIAVAIMTNLNPWVPVREFGAEAHFMRIGGLVEVLAQYWKINPDDAREILALYPRDDFPSDSVRHVQMEARDNPGSRFGCLCSLYSFFVPKFSFRLK